MSIKCSNSWGGWRGGGPGTDIGFWQLPDAFNLALARIAVLENPPGTYVDIFIGSPAAENFICRLQHQLFDGNHHAKVISSFFATRLGAYVNSVLDLTDSAELEIDSGSLTAWDSGIASSGDVKFLFHFMGGDFRSDRIASIETQLWDSVGTPDTSSYVGVGWVDPDALGNSLLGGLASDALDEWYTATIGRGVVGISVVPVALIFSPTRTMPTSTGKITITAGHLGDAGSIALLIGSAKPHVTTADSRPRNSITNILSPIIDVSTIMFQVETAASTTISSVIEVINGGALQTPASAY